NPPWLRRVFLFRLSPAVRLRTQYMHTDKTPHPSRTLMVAGFAAIYVVWGSTYLAIRMAVETLPPFLSAGFRFLIAGGLLFAFLAGKGLAKPSPLQWR